MGRLVNVEDEAYLLGLFAALLIAFAALGCLAALFFVNTEDLDQPLRPLAYVASEDQTISSSADDSLRLFSSIAANNSEIAIGVLDNDMNNDGAADPLVAVGFLGPLAATNRSEVTVSVLDNDLDHDGNPDGLADPLIVLSVLSVLAALVSGSLLLALCEPPTLSSICTPVLKRPG